MPYRRILLTRVLAMGNAAKQQNRLAAAHIDASESAVSWHRNGVLFGCYLLLAVVWTWPLATSLASSIPMGREHGGTIPLFNLWTLRWNADRIAHLYQGYWNAPIFFPIRDAFVLSDPQPFTGAVFAIFQALTGSSAVAYNLVILATLALNAYAGFFFLGVMGAPFFAAALGGVLAISLPLQCLRLHLVQGIGPLRFRNLIEHFSSVEAILRAPRRELERVKNIGPATSEAIRERHDEEFVEAELRRAENLGIRVVCREDDDYPALLKEIPDAPICLYVKGTLSPKDNTSLAIVGPRRCSQYDL